MSLNLGVPSKPTELKPRIVVFGVGGAGGNAVDNMIESGLEGVQCVVANTDAQALGQSRAERKIQLGRNITQGLGAGSRPDIGRAAAEEGIDEILEHVQDSHMVFIAAGMGGGTGTGAAPVIARAARDQGILTVGVVTKPFHFEGPNRMDLAEEGIEVLQQFVDTLIVIPNQNLFRVATEKTTFADAFRMADNVLYSGVRGVTDLMVMPGLINLDFADVRAVMSEMGKAMMGAGESDGPDRGRIAAEAAISNPLLDDVSMKGARGVLINITGGRDMTLFEVDEAVNRVRDEVDPRANLIFGSAFDDTLDGKLRVSVFATGIDGSASAVEPVPESGTEADAGGIRLVSGGDGSAPGRYEVEAEAVASEDLPVSAADEAGDEIADAEVEILAAGDDDPEVEPELESESEPAPELEAEPAPEPEPEPEPEPMVEPIAGDDAPAAAENRDEDPESDGPELFESAVEDEAAEGAAPAEENAARFPVVEGEDRIPTSSGEEADLLEIPAFLRRQAN